MTIIQMLAGVILATGLMDGVDSLLREGEIDPTALGVTFWSLMIVWGVFLVIVTLRDIRNRIGGVE